MKMDTRQPSLADKKAFSQNIYLIGSEDLGKLVQVRASTGACRPNCAALFASQILDSRCDVCIRKIDPDDIEIDIDAIDAATFWVVDQFVKDCLGTASKKGAGSKKAKRARTS